MISPWVHQSITGTSFLVAASKLPDSMLNYWDNITGMMINTAAPAFNSSGGIISTVTSLFKSKERRETTKAEEEKMCLDCYGSGLDLKIEVDRLVMKYMFEENTKGANDEARLCLKSTEGTDWDAAESYPELVEKLKGVWEEKVAGNEGNEKLRVKIVFAEKDAMIGKKGPGYFEKSWTQEKCGSGIDVECVRIPGTDHDSVMNLTSGVLGEMFAAAKASAHE